MLPKITIFLFTFTLSLCFGSEVHTRFLIPGEPIFKADFEDGKNPGKPNWPLRKSTWELEDGVLAGKNAGGNEPFIRLHSKEKGGVLPEDYIITFSFKIGENPKEKKSNKHHEAYSSGHRFSLGIMRPNINGGRISISAMAMPWKTGDSTSSGLWDSPKGHIYFSDPRIFTSQCPGRKRSWLSIQQEWNLYYHNPLWR